MSRLIIGPFNRAEGDLEVRLDMSGDMVVDARVVSPLYRGFEAILTGKPAADALVYAPRICGICSVSQSVAAAKALAATGNISMPPDGQRAINLIHAVENIADHLTHFYLFFMPDFARAAYEAEDWYAQTAPRFAALRGEAARDFLPARAQLMQVMGILAGKWPHTLSIQPGGSTRAVSAAEKARLQALVAGFRRFLERTTFGDKLETVLDLSSADALAAWATARPYQTSDVRHFLHLAQRLRLNQLGRSIGTYMSFGAYPQEDGFLLGRGIFAHGEVTPLDLATITEDVSHAWYEQAQPVLPPQAGVTVPNLDNQAAYSWCKAPRLAGAPVEVGALARQLVAGQDLIRDLVQQNGGNVLARIVARVREAAQLVVAMENWLAALNPQAPFIHHDPLPEQGTGVGLTEAARGALGHWLGVERGAIAHYQIITPTTWNFSPRDVYGVPGPLEQALRGTPIRHGEVDPVAVQHVVRSFDPCMACTVH